MAWTTKKYSRINWRNRPSTATALGATNLNHMDVFLNEVDNALIEFEANKLNISTANGMLKSLTIDTSTGIIVATELSGKKYTWDLNLEKIPVSFSLASNGVLTMTTSDGTKFTANISDLIKEYVFDDSTTIDFTREFRNNVYHVTAVVKHGSLEESHFKDTFAKEIRDNKNISQTAANDSLQYSKDSKRWAVGDSEYEGSATDNSKYYKEEAEKSKNSAAASEANAEAFKNAAQASKESAEADAGTATQKATAAAASEANAKTSEVNSKKSETESKASEIASKTSETNAKTSETNAKTSETNAKDYSDKSQSYAVGDTGTRENENVDNSKYYYEQAKRISQGLEGALLPMGTITFSQLENQTKNAGYMYNISDSFTTTADFKEGAGHTIPAGANVYRTADGFWDILAGTPVTGVKGAKESDYRDGLVNITPENIGAPTTQEACLLKGGTAIPAGADLKDSTYINVGNYYCAMTATAITLKNCPFKDAFILKVEFPTGENYSRYRRQKFIRYSDGKIITRRCDLQAEGGTMWFDEYESVLKDDLTAENTAATDTHALLGTAGADSTVQALIDEIADRVIDKLLPRDGSKAMTGSLKFESDTSKVQWTKNGERLSLYPSFSGDYASLYKEYRSSGGGTITQNFLLDSSHVIDSLDSDSYVKPLSANMGRELNEKLDGLGLSPYAYLYVEPGMTDAQIDEWIRTYFAGGIRRLKIYNGITSYKFGHTGNFNIWMYGDNASEGTGIAIDHWSNQAFLVKTTGSSGDIYVERLVKESESPFLHHAIIEVIPSTTSVIYEYVNPAIKNKSMIIVAFSGTVGSAVVCPYIKSYINMRTKADNQYWGGEVSVNYLSAEGKITFEVLWIGSSQNVSSFKLTDIWY